MENIIITDVSPRDGLQNQRVPVSTAGKLELIKRLWQAGIRSIEATSFVSPKAVPQMADAAEVIQGLKGLAALRVSVLAPNAKGLERAVAAGAREVAVVLSATETMNQKNINMSLDAATQTSEQVLHTARAQGVRTRAYIAVAFACPFEGATPADRVLTLSERMAASGADEIVIADTIGAAAPAQVKALIQSLLTAMPADSLGVHFHNTRGMGVANAWAALEAGVRRFDASTGGIGGCPFAPGASGNVATEDLVLMAEQCGFSSGISLDGLMDAIAFAEQQLKQTLGGATLAWLRSQRARGRPIDA